MKVTTPESSNDNTVQVQASPAVLDSGIEPSVDASTQQASTSMVIEVGHTTALPASPTGEKKHQKMKQKQQLQNLPKITQCRCRHHLLFWILA